MRILNLAVLPAAGLLCAFSSGDPGFSLWGGRVGADAYAHLSADCETLTRTQGRNAAWGRWEMPLADIVIDGPVTTDRGVNFLIFRCRDGSDCIGSGQLETVTNRVADHEVTFDTSENASAFARRVADLKAECGIAA